MKPNDYLKKYKLQQTENFNHSEFAQDLTFDFISLIEWFRLKSAWNHIHFRECVKQIRSKWDAIGNKAIGTGLPEKLWNYFYSTVIKKSEEELFPEINKRKLEILRMNDRVLAEYLREYKIPVYSSHTYESWKQLWEKVEVQNNMMLAFAFAEYEKRMKRNEERERKQREDEFRKWAEEHEKRQQKMHDWFNMLLNGIRISKPTLEFAVLGLRNDATREDVEKAYRKLAMAHHPDKGGNQQKFVEITEAKNKCLAYLKN